MSKWNISKGKIRKLKKIRNQSEKKGKKEIS